MTLLALDPQTQLGQPLVLGIIEGSVYGLIALGLVLLYKSNRIFNFAQAEFGTIAALTAYFGYNGSLFGIPWHMPWLVAVLVGILLGTLSAVLTERLVIRPLFHQPKVIMVVGTVGVLLASIAVEYLVFPTKDTASLPSVTDVGLTDPAFRVGFAGYNVAWEQVLTLFVLIAMALAAAAFFRYSRQGTAILAVSQEPTAAATVGISISRVSLLTWTLAGFLGSVAGIVSIGGAPLLVPGIMTGTALVGGITAAVLGGVTSMPGAFVGGLLVGLVHQYTQAFFSFPGAQNVMVGLVLLVVLLSFPRGLLGSET
ncbi:MAG: branched-chain amino acid transport system permease protein [Frankiales bacterium]|nr:branched-chain amino acid transport system permease protein [Frankiales bacterium]